MDITPTTVNADVEPAVILDMATGKAIPPGRPVKAPAPRPVAPASLELAGLPLPAVLAAILGVGAAAVLGATLGANVIQRNKPWYRKIGRQAFKASPQVADAARLILKSALRFAAARV